MNLLIVESPAKAKTIEKYLGKDWRVVASVGHVRDLVPEDGSVDVDKDFEMKWQIMPGKEKHIKTITDELKKADALYLATDPDREGEAISWHIFDILNSKKALAGKPVYRVVFHEITKNAVQNAIANPREIDQNLVDAYLVRRALDYLIGFKLSPVLWRRNLGKSAGRVQSVAVALVVEREREIEKFKPVEYWSLDAMCAFMKSEFKARLTQFNGEKIEKLSINNNDDMQKILAGLGQPIIKAEVISVEKKKTSRRPAAPFTTSTLQQEAARKLYFSSKKTMSVAQKLYEQGFITYMRTDATNLSNDAVSSIRGFINDKYGDKFLPKSPILYATKSKNAQEAHEAIRPTDVSKVGALDGDEYKLYDLIWKRTVACQMTNAEFDSVVVDIKAKSAIFHAVGTTRTFDGFMKVYIEDIDDKDDDNDGETKLPPLSVGDAIDITELLPEQHFTAPPPRYSEASLVKKLEELGIGRPSTYATIMSTIVDREYVTINNKRFFPSPSGWLVAAFLARYFADIIAVDFTAKTEDTLDDVSNGEQKRLSALTSFWQPFSTILNNAKDVPTPEIMDEINKSLFAHLFPDDNNNCPECGVGKLGLKVSRFGAFLGCGNYPKCKYTKHLSATDNASNNEGNDNTPANNNSADLGEDIKFLVGRFGPYVQSGSGKDAKRAAAKKYSAETITLEIAKELLAADKAARVEPLELGKNPATDKMIYYYPTGRYGAYISSNKVNVSVKEQPSLDAAAELINNKKPAAKRAWGKKK
ncbi:MAG: type I DNA topoisomerase [Alphaproteobacteria bacterium]|nr:type I DNA topoisomerase [Alphaproteobacteria bacterium]